MGIDRRSKQIVAAALALYAGGVLVTWALATQRAEHRIAEMLDSAVRGYAATIYGEIEAALRFTTGALINQFGGRCGEQPVERMRSLAETFNIDEVNLVDRGGRTLASNVPECIGVDFRDYPETREFLSLTNASVTKVMQPFRRGASNPEMVCTYYGAPFPGHDGFVQVGMTSERLRQNMYTYTPEEAEAELRKWHFSVSGWYERADRDPGFEVGRQVRRRDAVTGERVVGRYFDFVGLRYVALLPYSYCYAQRNAMFLITAAVLAVLFAVFTAILLRLSRASAKLVALHAAADARTAADLALARKIQMSALPLAAASFPDVLELSVSAGSQPAREVGGDFYDFYALPGGRLAFVIADVSGKGIPAALFMMEAKNVIRNCLVQFPDLDEAVRRANERLCENNEAGMFVTAWVAAIDPREGTVEYVNAGHCRPFVRHADGAVEKVMGKGGRFLGMFEDAAYRSRTLVLRAGDRLTLYTDGVTEAMNVRSEQFGEARLAEALRAGNLSEALAAFVGRAEQSDDLTVMEIVWKGAPAVAERTFAGGEESLGPAVEFLRAALEGVDAKSRARLLNAADEIVSNIVNYSGSADFAVRCESAGDCVRLTFADSGAEYNPLSHVDPDTRAPIEERPIGGLGLVMVKRLADRVAYAREGGRNVLRLIKRV